MLAAWQCRGLPNPPEASASPEQCFAHGCGAHPGGVSSEFYVVGSGGLPRFISHAMPMEMT